MVDTAEASVTLAIGFKSDGVIPGSMKVAEAGGMLVIIAKLTRPLCKAVSRRAAGPSGHRAMILNMS